MLYLIRSFGKNKTALKIGFTDNIENRMNIYKAHNPFFELISTREGTFIEEAYIHLYLEALGYKEDFLNEWFIDTPEIYQIFHERILSTKVKRTIWRNRDNLFKQVDFSNKLGFMRILYEHLREIFKPKFNQYKEVDRLYTITITKEKLEKAKSIDLDSL